MEKSYDNLINLIFSRGRFGIKPGLDRIIPLLGRLGNPEKSFKCIHVCGTNGKGSTSAFLSSILSESGYRTALFTSPHLMDYAERFRIDGKEISHEKIVKYASNVLGAAESDVTFFELTTATAALTFAQEGVDIAVMEAGMGGVNDATNALSGIMSVITPIAIDHTDYLGKTLSDIARDKAGIIKKGNVVVSAFQPDDVLEQISIEVQRKSARLFLENIAFKGSWQGDRLYCQGISSSYENLSPSIGGRYQSTNASLAIAASELLSESGICVPEDAVKRGIENAVWRGRMQRIKGEPDIILDGAHNPAGAEALACELKLFDKKRKVIILGVMNDKDAEGIVTPLAEAGDYFITLSPSVDRAASSEKVASIVMSLKKPVKTVTSPSQALELASENAGVNGLVVVCGSLYLVGEMLSVISKSSCRQIRG